MTYSATARQNPITQKWAYYLSRDGRICAVSGHCYLTRDAAIRGARRKMEVKIERMPLSALAGNIKFQVSK